MAGKERPGLGAEFEHAIDAALDLLEEEIVPLTSVPGVAGTRGVKRLMERDTEILVDCNVHIHSGDTHSPTVQLGTNRTPESTVTVH